ncbi:peptide/nickel transport system permease protein [Halovenus aranensis]|jgi:peptide/nickel transport system permease protein|uniref:Peptide/nickel transport system permease protein n=1 Tax=Halovenus aranensis TaxID=890420 RepID=A0A1G8YMM6_9EURY|nr:ABC transporter permease [Halovenus aranensis]SDK03385.1 peptide/nickel transport system permease protein [Halovenus aranensis]
MSFVRLIAQRIALGLFAAWSALSLVFLAFTATEDYVLEGRIALAAYGGADETALERIRESYFAKRGTDRPLLEQYVDWMSNMFTLQWGESFQTGDPVRETVGNAVLTTGTYVLPAIVLAVIIALLVGVYTAMRSDTVREGGVRSVAYLGLGVPYYWIGALILTVAGGVSLQVQWIGRSATTIQAIERPFLYETVVPMLLVTMVLVPAILSYARAYSMQYVAADTTRLVRAKGGGQFAVARHVLRNAAIPLVSLVFTETLALLAISVFVIEAMFALDGLGLVFYNAVWTRDIPIMMSGVLVVIVFGVVGNILQDLGYSVLDPRVDTGTR